jgi:carboxypeptidase C (cathepsin A)
VDPAARGHFKLCSSDVDARFAGSLDRFGATTSYIASLLERGVHLLIYVGENDWTCNWIGNRAWTEALDWRGSNSYKTTPMSTWTIDGKVVGKYKTSGGLTYATVQGAGHFVSVPSMLRSKS